MTSARSPSGAPVHGDVDDAGTRGTDPTRRRASRSGVRSPFRIPLWLGFCAFLAIALFFLWQEHRAHLLGALPWVLLLLCPILHFFMHHGERHESVDHAEHGGAGPSGRRAGGVP